MPERNKGYDCGASIPLIRLSIITIVLWLKTILRTLDHTLSLGILAALKLCVMGDLLLLLLLVPNGPISASSTNG